MIHGLRACIDSAGPALGRGVLCLAGAKAMHTLIGHGVDKMSQRAAFELTGESPSDKRLVLVHNLIRTPLLMLPVWGAMNLAARNISLLGGLQMGVGGYVLTSAIAAVVLTAKS